MSNTRKLRSDVPFHGAIAAFDVDFDCIFRVCTHQLDGLLVDDKRSAISGNSKIDGNRLEFSVLLVI
jgi:hypothetical protein